MQFPKLKRPKIADPRGLDFLIASAILFAGLVAVYGFSIALLVLGGINYAVTVFAMLGRK